MARGPDVSRPSRPWSQLNGMASASIVHDPRHTAKSWTLVEALWRRDVEVPRHGVQERALSNRAARPDVNGSAALAGAEAINL
jgi:hypothetical protein